MKISFRTKTSTSATSQGTEHRIYATRVGKRRVAGYDYKASGTNPEEARQALLELIDKDLEREVRQVPRLRSLGRLITIDVPGLDADQSEEAVECAIAQVHGEPELHQGDPRLEKELATANLSDFAGYRIYLINASTRIHIDSREAYRRVVDFVCQEGESKGKDIIFVNQVSGGEVGIVRGTIKLIEQVRSFE